MLNLASGVAALQCLLLEITGTAAQPLLKLNLASNAEIFHFIRESDERKALRNFCELTSTICIQKSAITPIATDYNWPTCWKILPRTLAGSTWTAYCSSFCSCSRLRLDNSSVSGARTGTYCIRTVHTRTRLVIALPGSWISGSWPFSPIPVTGLERWQGGACCKQNIPATNTNNKLHYHDYKKKLWRSIHRSITTPFSK